MCGIFGVIAKKDIDLNNINIYTDAGRCCRPLYIVKNNRLLITKKDIDIVIQLNKLKKIIFV